MDGGLKLHIQRLLMKKKNLQNQKQTLNEKAAK